MMPALALTEVLSVKLPNSYWPIFAGGPAVSLNKADFPTASRPLVLSQNRLLEVASAELPLPKRIEPALKAVEPVPPLATPSAEESVRLETEPPEIGR